MLRTRIKFCGITNRDDALAASALGVDALGFVFHPPSPRYIEPDEAAAICAALPPFVTRVGLFVNAEAATIARTIDACDLDLVQFHGDETPADCARAPRPWLRALRVRASADIERGFSDYAAAAALLLDAYNPRVYGGSGETFDWSRVPAVRPLPVILAGGLTPYNVAEAITRVSPYAVDVSGGIERDKGIKDHVKMKQFVNEVRRLERSN